MKIYLKLAGLITVIIFFLCACKSEKFHGTVTIKGLAFNLNDTDFTYESFI